MTLDATEKVYQADLMHLTPASDSQIYGYGGSWILGGLELDYQDTSAQLHPGTAILQGRLYELNEIKTIDLTPLAGNGYIGLLADLTKMNIASGQMVTNNQYTIVAQTSAAFGDLLTGDLQAFIPLYKIAGGTATQVLFNYSEVTELHPNSNYFTAAGKAAAITFMRTGAVVTAVYQAEAAINRHWNQQMTILTQGTLPLSLRPVSTPWTAGGYARWGEDAGVPYHWDESFLFVHSDGTFRAQDIHNQDANIVSPGTIGAGTATFGITYSDPGLGEYYKKA